MKTILITGASSGIGKATAQVFHQKGWGVAATMRTPEKEQDLKPDDRLLLVKLDVADKETITNAVQETINHFGQVDVVLNNAGYGAAGPLEAGSEEQIRRQFEVNLFGVIDVTRAVLPHFRENKAGRFINVTSIGGLITLPLFSLYHATKWGVEGFTEALQYELNPLGIDLKIVEPGGVNTDFAGRSLDMFDVSQVPEYEPTVQRLLQNFTEEAGRTAGYSSPEDIAEVVYQAATDENGQLRFLAGEDAKQFWQARQNMPYEDFRAMIKEQMLG